MAEVLSFNAASFTGTYLGFPITGMSDGDDSVTFEASTESATMMIGMHGDAGVAVSTDNSATVTVKLLQGSETCELLQNKLNAQKLGALITGPMIWRDSVSGTLVICNKTFISKQPSIQRGSGYNTMLWEFKTPDLKIEYKAES